MAETIRKVNEKVVAMSKMVLRVDQSSQMVQEYLLSEPGKRPSPHAGHSTPAHNLIFLWPSVYTLLRRDFTRLDPDYVMKVEDRPLLDPYAGRPGLCRPRVQSCDHRRLSAPPHEGPLSPTQRGPFSRECFLAQEGGLMPDGSLDIDRSTLEEWQKSYFNNIHILHPFLNKEKFRAIFDTFLEELHSPTSNMPSSAGGVSPPLAQSKRKRSEGEESVGVSTSKRKIFLAYQQRPTDRAIVWLVLALGKVCSYKAALPKVFDVEANDQTPFISSSTRSERIDGIVSSPTASVPKLEPTETCKSSQLSGPLGHTKDAISGGCDHPTPETIGRNLDTVPGLAYYCKATEVLGSQIDGNELVHAHVFLLAALYKGQLVRPKESMSWIAKSVRVVCPLLQEMNIGLPDTSSPGAELMKMQPTVAPSGEKSYRDSVILTSWTCLQLESDILAECRYPLGGMPALPFSHFDIPDDGTAICQMHSDIDPVYTHKTVTLFYTAHTFLRTKLNQVHADLYGIPTSDSSPDVYLRNVLYRHEFILTRWRESLPPELWWKDNDKPSPSILHARLRAEYWAARYIITRPILDFALHIMPHAASAANFMLIAKDGQGNTRDPRDIQIFNAIAGMPRPDIWSAVERCVRAADESTVAFDGIEGRPIVTNVHGTAHA